MIFNNCTHFNANLMNKKLTCYEGKVLKQKKVNEYD